MANYDEKYGLYLNCKTYNGSKEMYNYNSKDANQINTFLEGHAYVTELKYQHKVDIFLLTKPRVDLLFLFFTCIIKS